MRSSRLNGSANNVNLHYPRPTLSGRFIVIFSLKLRHSKTHFLGFLAVAVCPPRRGKHAQKTKVSVFLGTLGKLIQIFRFSPHHHSMLASLRPEDEQSYPDVNNIAYTNVLVSFAVKKTFAKIGCSEDAHFRDKVLEQEPTISDLHGYHPDTRIPHAAGALVHGNRNKFHIQNAKR